ncbi:RNA-guided endonuclease InsQ/TnpB family protein [Nocardia sp. GCM10030253]|uniref:RNA-guided endonuclease InsQ/TnpB family protein n=1 Tax=Nocardia sp. GCM10030253 TaxID=3273404 RepID=UPI00363A7B48
MKRVVVIKLTPTPGQFVALKATLALCNTGANMVSRLAHTATDRRPFALQKHVYAHLKALGLSAQPAIRVIKKVADAYATRQANLNSGNYGRPGSKRYTNVSGKPIAFREAAGQPFDDRCLSWQIDQSTVSIWSSAGRLRGVGFVCAPWQLKLLTARKGESDLVFRDGHFYLHATVDTGTPPPLVPADDPTGWLGVDLGIVNLAVTTADDPTDLDVRWSHGAVTGHRKRNQTLRTALQKVGTKSAKRKLKKRRRKETRYATDINHQLSKTIVAQAQRTGQGIAVEDLSRIRDRVRLGRAQRQQLHSWAFAQLRDQITYKAHAAGLPVQVINPRNTSKTCHHCGHYDPANRPSQALFRCHDCGWTGHADHNAALNIAALGHQSYRAAQSTVPKAATPLTAS